MKQTQVSASSPPKERILAFDILRGFFLVVIMINHIELYPNLLDFFTGKGRMLVSAAEGFFFMSGLLVGIVYRRRLHLGMRFIFKKMWTRAFELYLASIALTLLFTAAAIYFNQPDVKDGLLTDWSTIIKETVLMRYGFGWADFLDRFAILMLIAPFAFYLIAKGKWWLMLAASLIAWSRSGENFTLSWQILYNTGILLGFHWYTIKNKAVSLSRPAKKSLIRLLVAVTVPSFLFSYASVYVLSQLNRYWYDLPVWLQNFTFHWNSVNSYIWIYSEKWTMGPLRIILFFFWFTALFLIVNKYAGAINRYSRNFLLMLGQNSLFVYIAHAFIVFIFRMWIIPDQTNVLMNFLITSVALLILIGITKLYHRYRLYKAGIKPNGRHGLKKLQPETSEF